MRNLFSLTQIRHLMRVEFSRAQRYRYPLSCLVLSCDRLDQLRDLHGANVLEEIVEGLVELLVDETRTCDYLGRLADDRLMAILPHTDRAGAEALATRVLSAGRKRSFAGQSRPLQITLSLGLSHYADDNTLFFDSLVEAASGALDQAIGAGGDRFSYRQPGPASQAAD